MFQINLICVENKNKNSSCFWRTEERKFMWKFPLCATITIIKKKLFWTYSKAELS